jgi:aspartyl-tRNA(Asn)/glutamyl-tRNA(Gln) amidotransferase subunit A
VPCGFSSQGLPIGLQIGSRPGADETVLRVAHAYERSTSWHGRRPPTA